LEIDAAFYNKHITFFLSFLSFLVDCKFWMGGYLVIWSRSLKLWRCISLLVNWLNASFV